MYAILIMMTFLLSINQALAADQVELMSIQELKAKLKDGNLLIVDVRPKYQWDKSEYKIPGAVNEDSFEVDQWAKFYSQDMTVVIY
jgi:rhodanese-related sulfurtransferase